MALLLMLSLSIADAHKPSLGGEWDTPREAFQVDDPAVSIVVYQEITCDAPELWLSFDATAGQEVWVQAGVPKIDRLSDYRPSMALLAPGLPALEPGSVPFDVPAGLGGLVYEGSDKPSEFYEPFTGTTSWVLSEDWVTTPESGPSYLVAWDPGAQTGKLWLAMGVVEDFSDVDFTEAAGWSEQVNGFHETGAYEAAPKNRAEQVCDTAKDTGVQLQDARGCATGDGSPAGGAFVLLLGLLGIRRSSTPHAGNR